MSVFKGNCEWDEISVPVPSKNEWGIDVLTREFSGRADKYEAFVKGLAQGTPFSVFGGTFYLQTWTGQPHRSFPTVALTYKGLLSGKIPDPVYETDTSPKSCTKTVVASGTGGGGSPTPNRTYEITYISTQRTYRFVSNEETSDPPQGLTYDPPQIVSEFYVDDDGKKQSGFPSGLTLIGIVEGNRKSKIFGTPFWENQLTVTGVVLP
jgi:hypothetical protein